ncbi:MAG: hypothetical protein Q4A15_07045 [Prevotellaceae bacterium]|nr:hypothetical protein [Prevotellaceae bacterium]
MKKNYETPFIKVMPFEPRNIICGSKPDDPWEEIPIRDSSEEWEADDNYIQM